MYAGVYPAKQTGQSRESQKRTNKTGIPDTVKTRFEEMSGYSFEDVRVHYSSGKPAQFMALAYTQRNQVYIAPGQEKYLEHELTHVVQQKEGRVRPTFWMNNVPVNDDKSLEREADIHWHRGRGLLPAEGKEVSHQGVLQGKFIEGKICIEAYFEQIRKIFERFRKTGESGPWEYCEMSGDSETLCQDFLRDYSDIYKSLEEIAAKAQELKRDLARLDILKNLVEHCSAKPSDAKSSDDERSDTKLLYAKLSDESSQTEPQYKHYHLYENGDVVYDDNSTQNEAAVISSLSAAVDCRYIASISLDAGELHNVFWIESFTSFQKGKGVQLLKEIFSHENTEDIDNVALGAYPGTKDYYMNELGMQEASNTYVLDDGGQVVNKSEAVQAVINDLEDSLKEIDEGTKDRLIRKGLDELYLYPLFYVETPVLLLKLGIN